MLNDTKILIFDLGGVVLSRGLWFFREYLVKEYGVTDKETRGVIIHKYYKAYFSGKLSEEDFWKGVLSDLHIVADWKKLKETLLNFYEPNEGMFDLISSLREIGYKTYLLSDQTNDWWPVLNAKHNISDHFDQTFISSEIGVHKPEKALYHYVLNEIKCAPEQVLLIDDLQGNLSPAEKIGMRTLLYTNTQDLKTFLSLNIVDLE